MVNTLPSNSVQTDLNAVNVGKMDGCVTGASINLDKSTDNAALAVKNDADSFATMDEGVGCVLDAPVQNHQNSGFGMMLCEHCNIEVKRKTHNQRFCSDNCRMSYHEFRFKKKVAG